MPNAGHGRFRAAARSRLLRNIAAEHNKVFPEIDMTAREAGTGQPVHCRDAPETSTHACSCRVDTLRAANGDIPLLLTRAAESGNAMRLQRVEHECPLVPVGVKVCGTCGSAHFDKG